MLVLPASAQNLSPSTQNLLAQTPEEILAEANRVLERGRVEEGLSLTMEMKVPILGRVEMRQYSKGQKSRMVARNRGKESTVWTDGKTMWVYDASENEIVIIDVEDAGQQGNDKMKLMDGLSKGYDPTLESETEEAWFLRCIRRKDNHDKNAPKRIDLSVCKGSYLIREVSISVMGLKVVMKDFALGVDEKDVTFDPLQFPEAEVIDNRK